MDRKRFFTTLPLLGSAGFSPQRDDYCSGRSEGMAMPKSAKPVENTLLVSKLRTAVTLLFLTPCLYLSAQIDQPDRVHGEVIVRLADGTDVEEWVQVKLLQKSTSSSLTMIKELGIRHPLVLLAFDEHQIPAEKALLEAKNIANVSAVQYNYYVDFRTEPNDNEFFRQWDMSVINAPLAWSYTTGGTTAGGTPIVVAVMDSGFDISHEDLAPNLWTNDAEISGDGIDNDNNGYVDDVNNMAILRMLGQRVNTAFAETNPFAIRNTDENHLRSTEFQLAAFQFRERRLLFSLAQRLRGHIKAGKSAYEAGLICQTHMLALADAFVERVTLEATAKAVNKAEGTSTYNMLRKLRSLYALHTIEKHAAWYLEQDYLAGNKSKAIRRQVDRLCGELRPEAVALVDAFGIPASLIAAPIATN